MFKIHDVFQPPEITDLTEDPAVLESFALLKSHITGEVVPVDALARAQEHLQLVELLLVEFYLDKVRTEFYQSFSLDKFTQSLGLLEFAQEMQQAWLGVPKDLFTAQAQAQIKGAWSALVRSVIDFDLFDVKLAEYMAAHSICSPEGTHLISLLCGLGLAPETWNVIARIVPDDLDKHIQATCKNQWRTSVSQPTEYWLFNTYIPQLAKATSISTNLVDLLLNICRTSLANVRIQELFDMVLAFPDSKPGLEDLKLCIKTAELRSSLVGKFETECPRKLLNNGVTTVDIFLGYLNCIKAFSVIDPRGILLDRVSNPIREYLKNRTDSVALLVDGLMGQEGSPLAFLSDELRASPCSHLPHNDLSDPNWIPDPVDTPADFVKRQLSDTISTLLSIFDNKDIVTLQLTEEFARRLLLTQSDSDLECLCSKAEDLKRRFGGRQLSNVDVMIRDIQSSKQLNKTIHDDAPHLTSVQGLIISRLYWPSLATESTLKLPQRIQGLLDEYKTAYSYAEKSKRIAWIPRLGRVSVSVALEDRTIDLVVTPDQAVVLGAFETEPKLDLARLSAISDLPEHSVLTALKFWVDQGVIGSVGESYHVLENQPHDTAREGTVQVSMELDGDADNNYKDMQVYWSYIQHMLTNVGNLPADRIHQFLVMLVPKETPYVKTLQQLEEFLHAMVSEDKLKLIDDDFSIS